MDILRRCAVCDGEYETQTNCKGMHNRLCYQCMYIFTYGVRADAPHPQIVAANKPTIWYDMYLTVKCSDLREKILNEWIENRIWEQS